MEEWMIIKIEDDEDIGERLDLFLASELDGISRSKISKAIKEGNILVNGNQSKASAKLIPNMEIYINKASFLIPPILPEKMDLDIIYEDEDLMVINKPAGLLVHPTDTIRTKTLVNGLLAYSNDWSHISGEERPGIVHRLDAQTSGLLVLCKNDKTHLAVAEAFKERKVNKEYIAVLEGSIDCDGLKVEEAIGRNQKNPKLRAIDKNGKSAISYFYTIDHNEQASLARVKIITGRTHQIRVHAQFLGHPVIGDRLYGFKKQRFKTENQLLHAERIAFIHPWKNELMEFNALINDEIRIFCNKHNLSFR